MNLEAVVRAVAVLTVAALAAGPGAAAGPQPGSQSPPAQSPPASSEAPSPAPPAPKQPVAPAPPVPAGAAAASKAQPQAPRPAAVKVVAPTVAQVAPGAPTAARPSSSPSASAPAGSSAGTIPSGPRMQWATSLDEALGRARKEKKLVLVDFYTDWCGWCKRLDSDVFAKESFLAAAAGVVGVKVNAEREPALQRKYRVTSYPRLFFLGPDGAILEQVRGYLNLNDFTEKVKAVQRGESEYAVLRRAAGDPSNITALHRFARFLGDSDRLDEAIPYWQSVHDLALRQLFGTPPNQAMGTYHRDALLELGRAYLHVGLHDVGVQHLREVIGAYSDTPQAAQAADLLRRAEAARAATPKASP